jgi:hypothetical protein
MTPLVLDPPASAGHNEGVRAGGEPAVPARIQEINPLGALLVAMVRPPSGQPVWLRLQEPSPTNWVEVKVARITASGEIEVVFSGSCPNAVYKAMAHACTRQHQMSSPNSTAGAGGNGRPTHTS